MSREERLPPWLAPELLDSEQMRVLDSWAIETRGVRSLELMERAGRRLGEATAELLPEGPVRVLCGRGNNGGDGLVAARRLDELGFRVEALLIADPARLSPDAAVNLERLDAPWRTVDRGDIAAALEGSGVIVDALLGTGFAGEPREPLATAIRAANANPAPVVSADIASGVDASTGEVAGDPDSHDRSPAVEADLTVTFHAAKLGHYIAPGKRLSGRVEVVDIGIPAGDPDAPAAGTYGLIAADVLAVAPRRDAGSTKFSSGRVLVLGGSPGLTGAVCMAAMAAIRSGAGYATVAVPASLAAVFESKLTEPMSIALPDRHGHLGPEAAEAALEAAGGDGAALIGPGLGRCEHTLELAREVCVRMAPPLVLDADGLNAFAGRPETLAERRGVSILTPHAGELGRLLSVDSSTVEAGRLDSAIECARATRAVVVLKGDDTIVTDGERVAVNPLGAPSLATAGTGDVLAGVIAALVARGMEPFAAACAGVLAHTRAGREAAHRIGLAESVIASDVIEVLPAGLAADEAGRDRDRLSASDG